MFEYKFSHTPKRQKGKMVKDLCAIIAAYKDETDQFDSNNDNDDGQENKLKQTLLSENWGDSNVKKRSLILERTRAAKVEVVKRVPIFTQANHHIIVAVQSKFDEIYYICKVKYETSKQFNALKSKYCTLSRIELRYITEGTKCRKKLIVKRQKSPL